MQQERFTAVSRFWPALARGLGEDTPEPSPLPAPPRSRVPFSWFLPKGMFKGNFKADKNCAEGDRCYCRFWRRALLVQESKRLDLRVQRLELSWGGVIQPAVKCRSPAVCVLGNFAQILDSLSSMVQSNSLLRKMLHTRY